MAENRSAKPDAASDPFGQPRFVDEQQVVHDLACDAAHHRGDARLLARRGRERRMQRRVRGARFPAGARQEVRHARLVSEHQVGNDVARERAIAVRIEQPLDGGELAARTSVERGHVVAHVVRRTSAASHEPAAKAPTQCVALIDVRAAG